MPDRIIYDPEKLRKYPHLLPADVALWERWLDKHGDFFAAVEYDVHVGGEVVRWSEWSDKFYAMATTLEAKRIDVVGHKPGEIWIVEVKPEAGVSAIGQLVSYRILYVEKFQPATEPVCCLVTNYLTLDMRFLLDRLGFRSFLV